MAFFGRGIACLGFSFACFLFLLACFDLKVRKITSSLSGKWTGNDISPEVRRAYDVDESLCNKSGSRSYVSR